MGRGSSKEERYRLEQRLFVEGQGKKEGKKVTINAGREDINQRVRNKRVMAAGRFKSMGDASRLPKKSNLTVAA